VDEMPSDTPSGFGTTGGSCKEEVEAGVVMVLYGVQAVGRNIYMWLEVL